MGRLSNESERFVALLRGINVGGHNVKMSKLKGIFASLGFAEVETCIASGNLIFETEASADAPELETRISDRLFRELGYEVSTFVRTAGELAAIAAYPAFGQPRRDGDSLYVAFLHAPLDAGRQEQLAASSGEDNEFAFHGREIHWLVHGRFSDSSLTGGKLERIIGAQTTVRNVSTVRKLADKFSGA